jgi:hypothetical protein
MACDLCVLGGAAAGLEGGQSFSPRQAVDALHRFSRHISVYSCGDGGGVSFQGSTRFCFSLFFNFFG